MDQDEASISDDKVFEQYDKRCEQKFRRTSNLYKMQSTTIWKIKDFFLCQYYSSLISTVEKAGLILLNLTSWGIYNQVTEYSTDTEIIQRNLPNIVLRKLKPLFFV